MKNKERFLSLVSKEKTNTLEKNRERIKNRAMLRESQQIAIKVLKKLLSILNPAVILINRLYLSKCKDINKESPL